MVKEAAELALWRLQMEQPYYLETSDKHILLFTRNMELVQQFKEFAEVNVCKLYLPSPHDKKQGWLGTTIVGDCKARIFDRQGLDEAVWETMCNYLDDRNAEVDESIPDKEIVEMMKETGKEAIPTIVILEHGSTKTDEAKHRKLLMEPGFQLFMEPMSAQGMVDVAEKFLRENCKWGRRLDDKAGG